jgi:hypothetical protein
LSERVLSPLSPLKLHPLLHLLLEIWSKIIFSPRLSCLGFGATFARNTMKKLGVRYERVSKIISLVKDEKPLSPS